MQALMEADAGFVQPAARRNEVLGWVKEGLRDFSISRAAVAWGIPIPQDPAQTVYVWFDALLGYMSGQTPAALRPWGYRSSQTTRLHAAFYVPSPSHAEIHADWMTYELVCPVKADLRGTISHLC